MSLPVYVNAYSGYKATERPRKFVLDEVVYEIDAALDQRYERQRLTSKCRALKERPICCATTKTLKETARVRFLRARARSLRSRPNVIHAVGRYLLRAVILLLVGI
jgi:hypothetical protein